MKLLFGTTNQMKFDLMEKRLKKLKDIELVSPKELDIKIDINENGKTAEENAIIKAKAYYQVARIPVIAEDAGLYIDKFKKTEQPGLYVKRVNGKDNLSNDEILNYYIDMLYKYNGRSLAHYYSGVCVIDSDGNVFSDTIDETEFLLTVKKCKKVNLKGGILEPISYDLDAEKYFDERTEEEEEFHYKELDEKYREMVKKHILKK